MPLSLTRTRPCAIVLRPFELRSCGQERVSDIGTWLPKRGWIGQGSYRAYLRNSFMYFHALLNASIFSHSKHDNRSVPLLNCRYCTVEVTFWQLGSGPELAHFPWYYGVFCVELSLVTLCEDLILELPILDCRSPFVATETGAEDYVMNNDLLNSPPIPIRFQDGDVLCLAEKSSRMCNRLRNPSADDCCPFSSLATK